LRPELERASVDELYRRLRVALWGLLLTLGVVYSALSEAINQHAILGAILVGMFAVALLRGLAALLVRRSSNARLRLWTYIAGSTLTALGFALLNLIGYPLLAPTDVALLALLDAGICSAALISMGSSFLTYSLYMVPNLGSLSLAIAIGSQNSWTHHLLVLSMIYLVALVVLAMQHAISYRREVILRMEMAEMALRDNLTQLRNRRSMIEFMSLEAEQVLRSWRVDSDAARAKAPTSMGILMVDMDDFKAVNDTHGHDAGDAILIQLAALLLEVARKPDLVVRWGGEEFVIVARDTDRTPPSRLAERIRERVEQHRFRLPSGETVRCTCSIGYSVFPFAGGLPDLLTWEQVISVADAGMYSAKMHGRNRCVGVMSGERINGHFELSDLFEQGLDQAIRSGLVYLVAPAFGQGGSVHAEAAVANPVER
jgi:diguanylate cyclase (GGDEF)-like protein